MEIALSSLCTGAKQGSFKKIMENDSCGNTLPMHKAGKEILNHLGFQINVT